MSEQDNIKIENSLEKVQKAMKSPSKKCKTYINILEDIAKFIELNKGGK